MLDDENEPTPPSGAKAAPPSMLREVPLYLDANAFDSILDDPESERVAEALKNAYRVLVSASNFAELVPKDVQRGERLRSLALSLMRDNRLLDDPREILNRCLQQNRFGVGFLDITIPFTAETIGPVMDDPTHDEVVAKQRQQNIEVRKAGQELVKSLREVPTVLDPEEWARIRQMTCQEFVAGILSDDERLHEWSEGLFQAAGAAPYQVRRAPALVRSLDPWRTFLAALAASIYLNGIRPLPKVLGYSDMFQAVNLAWVEVIVTDDKSFRVLADEVARAALPGATRRVLSYLELRREILPQAESV